MAARVGCDPEAETAALKQCLVKVGGYGDDYAKVHNFTYNINILCRLSQTDVEDIVKNQMFEVPLFGMFPLHWLPSVDGEFMPEEPTKMLEERRFNKVGKYIFCPTCFPKKSNSVLKLKVPTIIGYNEVRNYKLLFFILTKELFELLSWCLRTRACWSRGA